MQYATQGLGLVQVTAGTVLSCFTNAVIYTRNACACLSAFNTKSQAGYQNVTKVGIYNAMTTACVT